MPSDPLTKTVTVILFKLTQPENLRLKMSNFGALPLKKFSLYSREYTEAVPRGGSHLRGLAPGQHSSEETSPPPLRCPGLGVAPQTSRSDSVRVAIELTGRLL